jgi:hypothetical protein
VEGEGEGVVGGDGVCVASGDRVCVGVGVVAGDGVCVGADTLSEGVRLLLLVCATLALLLEEPDSDREALADAVALCREHG